MNAEILRATGAFMAIVGIAIVGSTIGFGMASLHTVGVLDCMTNPLNQALCHQLVDPVQQAALVAGAGGIAATGAGAYAYRNA